MKPTQSLYTLSVKGAMGAYHKLVVLGEDPQSISRRFREIGWFVGVNNITPFVPPEEEGCISPPVQPSLFNQ